MQALQSFKDRGICQNCLRVVSPDNLYLWSNVIGWTAWKCGDCIDQGNREADRALENARIMREIERNVNDRSESEARRLRTASQ